MRRKGMIILGGILGYSLISGSLLGMLYIKATEPTSAATYFWVDYLLLGLLPVAVVFWLPRILWVALGGVAGSLVIELIASHLVVGCFTGHDCVATTLVSVAVPFAYLYCLVSLPLSIFVSSFVRRDGPSD